MKSKKLALVGAGGHAREVMMQMGKELPCFVEDKFHISGANFLLSKFDPNEYSIMIAIGDSQIRNSIIKKLPSNSSYFSFIHPTAIIGNDVTIGKGCFIGVYSIITSNVQIGNHTILNRSNHIGHDTVVGDHFSMMPGAIVSGNVSIGDNVYLGTNSTIREKITICNDVVLGLNSGVISNIVEKGIYAGTPAIKK